MNYDNKQRLATAAAQGFREGAAAEEQQAGAFQAALDIRTAQGWKLVGDKAPVLYTDEINGQQVCRDDVWLCTTDAFTHPSPQDGMAGWISVKDRLPEKNTKVLICFAELSIPSTGWYTASALDHEGWCYPQENHLWPGEHPDFEDGGSPTVTHWMPLPPAPTSAEGGGAWLIPTRSR